VRRVKALRILLPWVFCLEKSNAFEELFLTELTEWRRQILNFVNSVNSVKNDSKKGGLLVRPLLLACVNN
jgi:hypothetical protein